MHKAKLINIVCLIATVLLNMADVKSQHKQPNILFVLADDWSYPHAGIYGDEIIKTPNFDKVAKTGIVFSNSYATAPSCTPSRAAILTSQYPHQLQEGGNLWGTLPVRYPNYTDLLEKNGYYVGFIRKGWGPGDYKPGGYTQDPAGKEFNDFKSFFSSKPKVKPFHFWFGSRDPHRPYVAGSGEKSGINVDAIKVPVIWPNVREVKSDIADYYFAVQRLDKELGEILEILEKANELDNTLIVVTSDNGMPFPRGKANLYTLGTRMPLAISWKNVIQPNQKVSAFINHIDFAPTFLEAANIPVPKDFEGKSLMPIFKNTSNIKNRDTIFFERERHANVRNGDLSYPGRAVRTKKYLYIYNCEPDYWPAGDPQGYKAVGPFGDIDNSPTKTYMVEHQKDPAGRKIFNYSFAKRQAEELYDVQGDPDELVNLVNNKKFLSIKNNMKKALMTWMIKTNDPRSIDPHDKRWDKFPYYGKKL